MAANNRNYRPWMATEDVKLVEALVDMVNTGGYRADNGFKSGYLQHLERVLKESLPNSCLLAKPHIESRMKTLKRDWQTFHDMLNASGFGYDKERNTVTVIDLVWDDYVRNHKNARKLRGKMLPHYEELCVIFGKDRARGDKAKLPYQMEEDINIEDQNQQIDEDFEEEQEGSHNVTTNSNMNVDETSSFRTKKQKNQAKLILCSILSMMRFYFGDRMKESIIQLTEGLIKHEINMEKKTPMITRELSKMASLSQLERFRALKITSDPQNVRNFWALKEHEKADWVKFMLSEE